MAKRADDARSGEELATIPEQSRKRRMLHTFPIVAAATLSPGESRFVALLVEGNARHALVAFRGNAVLPSFHEGQGLECGALDVLRPQVRLRAPV